MAIGFVAAVLAACCYECGYMLQALEARRAPSADALRASLLARLASRRRWLAGTGLSLAGAALQILALTRAPVTLVQPVLALGLVALLLLARELLGERIEGSEMAGAGLVIAGVLIVGVASPAKSSHVSSVSALTALLATLALLTLLPYALRQRSPLSLAAMGAAAGDALAAVALKLTADAWVNGHPRLVLLGLAGAGCAGALALTAEMSALRGLPASRVAAVVVTAQVVVPAVAAIVAFGEPGSVLVVIGVAVAGAGAAALGGSGALSDLRAGAAEPEALAHNGGGGGQRGERVPG
jgi:drug/metabolite transporter (DMT)-like permease